MAPKRGKFKNNYHHHQNQKLRRSRMAPPRQNLIPPKRVSFSESPDTPIIEKCENSEQNKNPNPKVQTRIQQQQRVLTLSETRRKVTNAIQMKTFLERKKQMEESFSKVHAELAQQQHGRDKFGPGYNVFLEILKIAPVVELDDTEDADQTMNCVQNSSRISLSGKGPMATAQAVVAKCSPGDGELLEDGDSSDIEPLDIDWRQQQQQQETPTSSSTRTLLRSCLKNGRKKQRIRATTPLRHRLSKSKAIKCEMLISSSSSKRLSQGSDGGGGGAVDVDMRDQQNTPLQPAVRVLPWHKNFDQNNIKNSPLTKRKKRSVCSKN